MGFPRHPPLVRYGRRTPIGSVWRHGLWRDSPGPHAGRKLANFCFVYTLAGSTWYEDLHVGRQPLKPGDLLLVYPGVAHRYGNGPARGWDEYYVVFDGPVFDLWKNGLLDPDRPVINLQPVSYWHRRLASCVEGPEEAGLVRPVRQVVRLLDFMTEVFETRVTREPAGAGSWLNRACELLAAEPGKDMEWKAVARSLGMSSERFRKLFTRVMGVPPARYRAGRVIDRACEMVARGDKLGKEIAAELGFANEQHFSRRFRQATGMTLTRFRAQSKAGVDGKVRFPKQTSD
jgi:AraC-like DNA-binding protein